MMALPAAWTPSKGLPQGVARLDGFLGSAADKEEAEEQLGVRISTDADLWEQNEFRQYVRPQPWTMTSFGRVVLIFLFLKLKLAKAVVADWSGDGAPGDYYEEEIEGPLGRSIFNRWVVYGYVSPTERIVRSSEGDNYGAWVRCVLEPDSTPSALKLSYIPADGSRWSMEFGG